MFEATNQQSCLSLWDGTGPKKNTTFSWRFSWKLTLLNMYGTYLGSQGDNKTHTPCVIPSNSSEKKLSFMVFRAEFSKHQANVKLRQTNETKHHLALRLRRNLGICHQWQSVTPSLGVNSPLLIVLKIGHLRAVSGSPLGNMLGIGQKHSSKQTRDKKSSRTLQFLTQAIHIMNCATSSYACAQQIFMIFYDLLVDAIFPVFLVQTYSIFCSNLPLSSFVVFPPDIHLLIIILLNQFPIGNWWGGVGPWFSFFN